MLDLLTQFFTSNKNMFWKENWY